MKLNISRILHILHNDFNLNENFSRHCEPPFPDIASGVNVQGFTQPAKFSSLRGLAMPIRGNPF